MSSELILGLLTLISLEVVLGIDNIIFISILSSKLPVEQQKKVRRIGILLAAVLRIGLLTVIAWIMRLSTDYFTIMGHGISGKDIILILGGLFLIYKSAKEMYEKVELYEEPELKNAVKATFSSVVIQVLIMDMVFSIDSIITAVGMVQEVWVMYVAVIVSVLVMLVAAEPIANFVNKHPSFKILALSFLLLIGFALLVEGFDVKIPKGYIYFAMAFSLLVDLVQLRMHSKERKKHEELK